MKEQEQVREGRLGAAGAVGKSGSPSPAQWPQFQEEAWLGCAVCGTRGVTRSLRQGPECADSTK